ncbi:MAG: hypothetical protein L0K86_14560 [Actinomycetia bacterium]|nr:hypothetical protein [Actinomycetes bacterium]
MLADAVGRTTLDGSTSVAQVLHYRIRTALDGTLDPHVSSFADLLPRDLPERNRAGLEALAAAADARRADLGAELADTQPGWVREALGPAPGWDAPVERAAWEERAGWAGSWRDLAGHGDDAHEADPLGAAPPAGLAEKRAIFTTAHNALDLPTSGAEEEKMSEGKLRARVAAWEREQHWAPRYVADQLDATHEALRKARTDATVWAARADAEPDPLEADQLRAAAAEARQRADRLEPVLADLQSADDGRALWRIETAVTHDHAERARHAAALRGIDLDAPGDRVTAQEWLDLEHAARHADDLERDVTEPDVPADDNATEVERVDEPDTVEQPAPDIRETSVSDATERADPAHRRRTPPPDETATTVARAGLAVEEINRRRAAEAEQATTALDEDETRRPELARWAEDDARAAEHSADDGSALTRGDE